MTFCKGGFLCQKMFINVKYVPYFIQICGTQYAIEDTGRQLEDTSVWLPGAKASSRGKIKIFASVGSTAVKCTGAAD